MRRYHPPITDAPGKDTESVWPLDVSIAALAGLVLFLIVTQLRFDDPRWIYNAWTYAIAVPSLAFVLAGLSHAFTTKYVQKSIQLGFLFSVFVHLLLVILAINVIVFRHFFPAELTGVKQRRSPISRTVPEYLFQTPEQRAATPDWSRPVDIETTSRVVPEQQVILPPLDHTAAKLEAPRPRQPAPPEARQFLMKRQTPSQAQPQPADASGKLARLRPNDNRLAPWAEESPAAPDAVIRDEIEPAPEQRTIAEYERAQPKRGPLSSLASAAARDAEPRSDDPPSTASLSNARRQLAPTPQVSESESRVAPRSAENTSLTIAGATPVPPAIAIAIESPMSDRLLDRTESLLHRGSTADVSMRDSPMQEPSAVADPVIATEPLLLRNRGNNNGPEIAFESEPRPSDTGRPSPTQSNFAPAGIPNALELDNRGAESGPSDDAVDRMASAAIAAETGRRTSRTRASSDLEQPPRSTGENTPMLDLLLDDGTVGLGRVTSRRSGVIPSDAVPEIAAIELSSRPDPRRTGGGPATPFGTKFAAVESFSRRVMRTRGGAAPSPSGMIGKASEEAIERGLAYLAHTQQEDGSWSLQGHGGEVVLSSDTAATGLCLLAFQGAGYTHRENQYADTIGRGVKFLVDGQKTNGDLYRSEDELSNRNVALYSHGIAALALCEAYGMTQDQALRLPAQRALDYIGDTQHRRYGGWRYTPQVSADTSVTGWMMMALKSGELAQLDVPRGAYDGIDTWLDSAQMSRDQTDRYRYNPFAPDTPSQRHGRQPTPAMTAVGILMRMYMGWSRDNKAMQSAANYLLRYPPQMGTEQSPQRDGYYWYYSTMVMFHMGGRHWEQWNSQLKPILLESQIKTGPNAGSWDPRFPVADRWSPHGGRIYVTTMSLLNLEVYYRHLPIYDDSAE